MLRLITLFVIFLFPHFKIQTALADVPSSLEPEYAEAVLAFNGRKYDRAIQILDELIKEAPRTVEFLELKALALKSTKKPKASAEVYRALIRTKMKEKAPRSEIAPYLFELGMIYHQAKSKKGAKKYLRSAAQYGFNVGASHFFLGQMAFQDGNWNEALESFEEVISSKARELKPAAHFYLAQVSFKTGYPAGATQNFAAARELAQETINDPEATEDSKKVAQQIAEACEKALEPLNRSQWFGNVAILAAQDSNVLALPDSFTSTEASGKSSIKGLLQAGIGYMTSPLRAFQFVPNYRMSFNYNLNRDTRTGEFFTNFLSLYITRKPLSPFNYGMKLEGNYTFQNQVDPADDSATYRPYTHGGSIGPYAKYYLSRSYILGGEFFIGKRQFNQDDETAENLRRTATLMNARVYLQNDTGKRFWNPTYSLGWLSDNTVGTDYRSKGFSFGISDIMYLNTNMKLTLAVSYTKNNFNDRQPTTRSDNTISSQVALTRKMSKRLTLLADAAYIKNSSTEESSFSYSRWVLSAGISYSLF